VPDGVSTQIHLGYFDEEDAAGKEVDKWMRDNRKKGDPLRKLNFDSDGELAERQSTDSSNLKYCGVCKVRKTGRWKARIWDGTSQCIGTFATEKEAAEAARACTRREGAGARQANELRPVRRVQPGGEGQGGAATRQVGRTWHSAPARRGGGCQ
jgi:hypothetical protein